VLTAEREAPGEAFTLLEEELSRQPLLRIKRSEDLVQPPALKAAQFTAAPRLHSPSLTLELLIAPTVTLPPGGGRDFVGQTLRVSRSIGSSSRTRAACSRCFL
jgi:hypothetical protein